MALIQHLYVGESLQFYDHENNNQYFTLLLLIYSDKFKITNQTKLEYWVYVFKIHEEFVL